MRRLAAEADVSVRTIYNLFDGRDGLVTALVQQSFDAMEAAVEDLGSGDPIDRIWEAVSASVASNCRYVPRAVVAAVVSDPGRYRELAGRWRGRTVTVDAIRDATGGGLLRDDVAAARLVDQAGSVFVHLLREWAEGQIEEPALTAGVLYAFDVCLLAVARPKTRTRLLEHMGVLEPALPEPWGDDERKGTGAW